MKRLWVLSLACYFLYPSTTGGQAFEALPEWSTSVSWEVGDWDGPLAFTRVTDLLPSLDGGVYVAQPDQQEVWHLGPGGTLTNVLGRRGQGPGEFLHPKTLFWKGDTLAVWDRNSFRVSLFSSDGTFHRSFLAGVMSIEVGLLGRNSIVRVDGGMPAEDVVTGRVKTRALERQNLTSGQKDTLAILNIENSRARVSIGGWNQYTAQPFSSTPLWKVGPFGRRLVIVHRALDGLPRDPVFSLTVFDSTGTREIQKAIPFEPKFLDDGAIEWVIEKKMSATLAGIDSGLLPFSRQAVSQQAYRDAFYIPEVHPPVEDLALGPHGEIWLRRETAGDQSEVVWLVLDPAAEPIATIRLPRDLEVIQPGRDTVFGARRDELDVFHIVRFEVLRGQPNADGPQPAMLSG